MRPRPEAERRSLRLALRMPPRDLEIYNEVVVRNRSGAEVARECNVTRQRVSQILARARRFLAEGVAPTPAIAGTLPPIEAEAVAMAGIGTIEELVDRLENGRVPRWWPASVVTTLCKRFAIAVPGSALRKVLDELVEIQASASRINEAAGLTQRLLREHGDEALLRKLQDENAPSLAALKRELKT